MEICVAAQAQGLGFALLLGAALGLMYDVLRPMRRRAVKSLAAFIDVCFALASGAAAFMYAMAAPGGRLGLWELAGVLLGFTLYTQLASDRVFPLCDRLYIRLTGSLSEIKINIKKFCITTKLFFQNVQK